MKTMSFTETLKELREKAHLSQKQLADKIDVNYSYISKLESGTKPPPREPVITRLAEVLHADKEDLMLLAGKIPIDIVRLLNNQEAINTLRANKGLLQALRGTAERKNLKEV